MLVLTRKPKESIQCGEVTFRVLRIKGNRVSIGIEAPPDVPVTRSDAKVQTRHPQEAAA